MLFKKKRSYIRQGQFGKVEASHSLQGITDMMDGMSRWFFGVNALLESFTYLSHVTKKTHPSATKGTCLDLSGKSAKSALKQSDSVANSNIQGTGRCRGPSGGTAVQTLFQHTVYTRH